MRPSRPPAAIRQARARCDIHAAALARWSGKAPAVRAERKARRIRCSSCSAAACSPRCSRCCSSSSTVRRAEHIEQMVGERRFAVPLLVFLVVAAGSFALYSRLLVQELAFVLRPGRRRGQRSRRAAARRGRRARRDALRAWPRAGSGRRHGTYELVAARRANHVDAAPRPARARVDRRRLRRALGRTARRQRTAGGLDVTSRRATHRALRAAAERRDATSRRRCELAAGLPRLHRLSTGARATAEFDGFIAGRVRDRRLLRGRDAHGAVAQLHDLDPARRARVLHERSSRRNARGPTGVTEIAMRIARPGLDAAHRADGRVRRTPEVRTAAPGAHRRAAGGGARGARRCATS